MLVVGEIVKVRVLEQDPKSNKSAEPLLGGPATSEHMSALLPFKFTVSEKYDAILDSFVTTTTTMHVRAAKALFDLIMHKVCCYCSEGLCKHFEQKPNSEPAMQNFEGHS